jgi:hypothetical protein
MAAPAVMDGGSVMTPHVVMAGGNLAIAGVTSNAVVVADQNSAYYNLSSVAFDANLQPQYAVLCADAGLNPYGQLAFSDDGGRLVYQTQAGDLVAVNTDGTSYANLGNSGNGYNYLAISPSGAAFFYYTNVNVDGGNSYYTVLAGPTDGGTQNQVFQGYVYSAHYTGNGQALVVYGGSNPTYATMVLAQPDGTNPQTLPGTVNDYVNMAEGDTGMLYLADINSSTGDGTLYITDYTGTRFEALTGQVNAGTVLSGGIRQPKLVSGKSVQTSTMQAAFIAPGTILSVREHSPSYTPFQDGPYLIHWP